MSTLENIITNIKHNDKDILLLNFNGLNIREQKKALLKVQENILSYAKQGKIKEKDILLLSDFRNTKFSSEIIPDIKVFMGSIDFFTRKNAFLTKDEQPEIKDFGIFNSKDKYIALDWITND